MGLLLMNVFADEVNFPEYIYSVIHRISLILFCRGTELFRMQNVGAIYYIQLRKVKKTVKEFDYWCKNKMNSHLHDKNRFIHYHIYS